MDSSARTALFDFEIVNKNKIVIDSKKVTETASKADAWIRQRSKVVLT
jgi:hypothetical protein